MNTENDHKDKQTDEPKETDAALQSTSIEGQDDKTPAKKVKRQATQEQLDHPLHGVKLVQILESLVEHYGWEYLANEVKILCFKHNPSMKVSLKFLRKFQWAREHVEDVYLRMLDDPGYQKKQGNKNDQKK